MLFCALCSKYFFAVHFWSSSLFVFVNYKFRNHKCSLIYVVMYNKEMYVCIVELYCMYCIKLSNLPDFIGNFIFIGWLYIFGFIQLCCINECNIKEKHTWWFIKEITACFPVLRVILVSFVLTGKFDFPGSFRQWSSRINRESTVYIL